MATHFSVLTRDGGAWWATIYGVAQSRTRLKLHSSKVLELQLQHQSFQRILEGLISFRIDWFEVQGTLKSLLQHHDWKASILRHSAFFMVQLSHPCTTTGKTIDLTMQSFVRKLMSLLFTMLLGLSQLFFQGASVLISWLQSKRLERA